MYRDPETGWLRAFDAPFQETSTRRTYPDPRESYFDREVAIWVRLRDYLRALPETDHPKGLE